MKSMVRSFAVSLLFPLATAVNAAASNIVMGEFMVPAVDPGVSLYVRNKHPDGLKLVLPARIPLFVHGATYPGETTFGL